MVTMVAGFECEKRRVVKGSFRKEFLPKCTSLVHRAVCGLTSDSKQIIYWRMK